MTTPERIAARASALLASGVHDDADLPTATVERIAALLAARPPYLRLVAPLAPTLGRQ